MSLRDFVMDVKQFVIFKEHPIDAIGKDLDLFIKDDSLLDHIDKCIKEDFEISRLHFFYVHKNGFERRYITYNNGSFKLLDVQCSGYFKHGRKVFDYDFIRENVYEYEDGLGVFSVSPYGDFKMSFRRRMDWLKRLFKRCFGNQGTSIVLIGPDGVGKTSIAKELVKMLKVGFNAEYHYFGWGHFSPLMNFIYKFYRRKNTKRIGMKKKNLNPIKKLVYYMELYLRHFIICFHKKLLNRIIVSDRYFDPPKGFLVPKPDYLFMLRADPEVIVRRKNELTVDEIRTYYAKNTGFFEIDANQSREKVVKDILDVIAKDLIDKKEVLE